jgi:hypothetical protein
MAAPRLTFFCEMEADSLDSLIGHDMIQDLAELKASLSLGILDFSPLRAQVVQRLNQAGIPVVAWLLLPKDQGYWFNLENVDLAITRFQAFRAWTDENHLIWDGVGLDIEPDIREIEQLSGRNWFKLVGKIGARLLQRSKFIAARQKYIELIAAIHSVGWRVDSYQFPVIADERKSRSTLLQRLAGVVDLPVDREVWMLFSSFLGKHGPGLLVSYGPEAQSIGVGSTGGGVNIGLGDDRWLTWDEFSRDLRLAWHWNEDLHVFSLEGCASHNFMPRLKAFVWDKPILLPDLPAERINTWRGVLQAVLWVSAHMPLVLISSMMIWWAIWRLRKIIRNRV